MTVSISGTGGVTFNDNSVQDTAATGFGFKNRLINGAMVIDQRNAGASVTVASSGTASYTLDRWGTIASQSSKFTVQQNAGAVTPPAGFSYYLGVTSSSAYSRISTDYFGVVQNLEGFNTADLAWGTASASTVTLFFWVRSSLTGTFAGRLTNSASNRSYVFTYTISSANTWEQKTVTITGDTSGTWLTTNGLGLQAWFDLGTGSNFQTTAGSWAAGNYAATGSSVSVVGTNGATFYITGVQLEKGSTATSFDYRPYGTELVLCQRYYTKIGASSATFALGLTAGALTASYAMYYLPVTMRSAPTSNYSGLQVSDENTYTVTITSQNGQSATTNTARVTYGHGSTGGSTYRPAFFSGTSSSAFVDFSSEL